MFLLKFVLKTYRFVSGMLPFTQIFLAMDFTWFWYLNFYILFLLYAWSLGLMITDFKVILNTDMIGRFKDLEILSGLSYFQYYFLIIFYHKINLKYVQLIY